MRTASTLSRWPHAFTGVGDGDLRPGRGDAAARLVATLGGEGALAIVSQVHGGRVVDVAEADGRTEADAIVSTVPGRVVAVRVADCVPVLLASEGGVAAIHAGWRSTAADIVRTALATLRAVNGGAPIVAAIGPAIGGCCYEVGDEVIAGVAAVAPGRSWLDGRHVDLVAANAAILRDAGVEVEIVGACTRCGEGLWSHRRDGERAGRQVGAIRL